MAEESNVSWEERMNKRQEEDCKKLGLTVTYYDTWAEVSSEHDIDAITSEVPSQGPAADDIVTIWLASTDGTWAGRKSIKFEATHYPFKSYNPDNKLQYCRFIINGRYFFREGGGHVRGHWDDLYPIDSPWNQSPWVFRSTPHDARETSVSCYPYETLEEKPLAEFFEYVEARHPDAILALANALHKRGKDISYLKPLFVGVLDYVRSEEYLKMISDRFRAAKEAEWQEFSDVLDGIPDNSADPELGFTNIEPILAAIKDKWRWEINDV